MASLNESPTETSAHDFIVHFGGLEPVRANAIGDTGAEISCISRALLEEIERRNPGVAKQFKPATIRFPDGSSKCVETWSIPFRIQFRERADPESIRYTVEFAIVDNVPITQVLLSRPVLMEAVPELKRWFKATSQKNPSSTPPKLHIASSRSDASFLIARVAKKTPLLPLQSTAVQLIPIPDRDPSTLLAVTNDLFDGKDYVLSTGIVYACADAWFVDIFNNAEQAIILQQDASLAQLSEVTLPFKTYAMSSIYRVEMNLVDQDVPYTNDGIVDTFVEDIRKNASILASMKFDPSFPSAAALMQVLKDNVLLMSDDEQLGAAKVEPYRIDTGDRPPVKSRFFRVSPHQKETLNKAIQDMIRQGVISQTSSAWNSGIFIVAKKNGDARPVVDFRALNAITEKVVAPLPHILDSLEVLVGALWFSIGDLKSGYWQIRLHVDDREKTAFSFENKTYCFNVLAFGLCNAPAYFQQTMLAVLGDLVGVCCQVFIDDIIIFSKTHAQHVLDVEKVLRRLKDANLFVNLAKCSFAQQEVKFLGHVISKGGEVRMDPALVEKVRNMPLPTTVTEVRSFLGLAGFYRRMLKDFATITDPLLKAVTGKVEGRTSVVLQSGAVGAFEHVVRLVTSDVVLILPNFKERFYLETDASDVGVGAQLGQMRNGRFRPVGYTGKAHTGALLNYSTHDQELYAVVFATQHWRIYLVGAPFTVITDHKALVALKQANSRTSDPHFRRARWIIELMEYTIEWIFRPGELNGVADALSRLLADREKVPLLTMKRGSDNNLVIEDFDVDDKDQVVYQVNGVSKQVPTVRMDSTYVQQPEFIALPSEKEIAALQQSDPDLATLRKQMLLLKRDLQVSWCGVVTIDVKRFDLLVRKADGVILAPRQLTKLIMCKYHEELAHMKKFEDMAAKFCWKSMRAEYDFHCASCRCQLIKKKAKIVEPLHSRVSPVRPNALVAIDTVGPFPPSKSGKKFIITMMDWFSKYPHAVAVEENNTESVIKVVSEWISLFGEPLQILSDRGSNYTSAAFNTFCQRRNILLTHTTAYNPRSNGLIERFNRTLQEALAMWVSSDLNDWDDFIRYLLQAYRVSRHTTTEKSPLEMMFGYSASSDAPAPTDMQRYLAWHAVRNIIVQKQQKAEEQYNKKARESGKIKNGDLVSIWFPPLKRLDGQITTKLLPPLRGPFRVTDVTTFGVVTFTPHDTLPLTPKLPSYRVHINRCVKFVPRPNEYMSDSWKNNGISATRRAESSGFSEWQASTYNSEQDPTIIEDWQSDPIRDVNLTNPSRELEPPQIIPEASSSSMDVSELPAASSSENAISDHDPRIRHFHTWRYLQQWSSDLKQKALKPTGFQAAISVWRRFAENTPEKDGFTQIQINNLSIWLSDKAKATFTEKVKYLISNFENLDKHLADAQRPTLPLTNTFYTTEHTHSTRNSTRTSK